MRLLETAGTILGYTAIVDREAIGWAYERVVWVTLMEVTRESMSAFASAVQRISEVIEVLRMMGQPDYMLRVATAIPQPPSCSISTRADTHVAVGDEVGQARNNVAEPTHRGPRCNDPKDD